MCRRLGGEHRAAEAEPERQGALAALRQALQQRLGAFTLPLPAGEHCTQRVDVEATTGKTTKLSLRTSDALGARVNDSLQFKCERAAD